MSKTTKRIQAVRTTTLDKLRNPGHTRMLELKLAQLWGSSPVVIYVNQETVKKLQTWKRRHFSIVPKGGE